MNSLITCPCPFKYIIANQLKPVIKNAKKNAIMNLKEDIFFNFPKTKKMITVNPTNISAAGPFVSNAKPKKKPAVIAVRYPKLPMGLLVCRIKQ